MSLPLATTTPRYMAGAAMNLIAPHVTLLAAAITRHEQRDGRARDEWFHAQYRVWHDKSFIKTDEAYGVYLAIYAELQKEQIDPMSITPAQIETLLQGHGLSGSDEQQLSQTLFHLFSHIPFLPVLLPPTATPTVTLQYDDVLVASAISAHYYHGCRPSHESERVAAQLDQLPPQLALPSARLTQLLAHGMVAFVTNNKKTHPALATFAARTSRRLFSYPDNDLHLPTEQQYTVETGNTTISISNHLLSGLSIGQTVVVLNDIEALSDDEYTLLLSLFQKKKAVVHGIQLDTLTPPLVVLQLPPSFFSHIDQKGIEKIASICDTLITLD